MSQDEIFQKVTEITSAQKGFQPDTITLDSSFEELDMDFPGFRGTHQRHRRSL